MPEPRLDEKVVAIEHALATAGVPHAFGGAIALGFYAEPRATFDIDLNVFVPPDHAAAVLDVLGPLGVDTTEAMASLERTAQCRAYWGRTPVDLFLTNFDFHEAMARGARPVDYGGDEIPILAPEHLMVCKALFDRPKDWLDIEQMLVSVADLRVAEVRRWMSEIAGDDDGRTQRVDAMIREMLAR
jgi:hypothetical protein